MHGSWIRKRENNGFTLIEIAVVIIIVMALAAIAIPKYYNFVERSYAATANKYLQDVYSAELRYALYHHDIFAADTQSLDVQVPIPVGYIDPISGALAGQFDAAISVAVKNSATSVTSLQRMRQSPWNYTLSVNASGRISCTNPVISYKICQKIGY